MMLREDGEHRSVFGGGPSEKFATGNGKGKSN